MKGFTLLTQDIYCLDAFYIREQVAAIYLIRQADEVAIIETGTCHSIDNVLHTLAELGIARSQVKYVIPTHVHLDHAGGASEMMKHFSQASLIVHPRGARHMTDPEKLIAGSIAVYGEKKYRQLYGDITPIAEDRVIVANDLDRFTLDSRELVFIDTPGHARHHFCIYDQQSAGVFTGDTFGISYNSMKNLDRGLVPTTPPVQFDPDALHQSIERIMAFKPQKLYLTHFGEYLNPARQLASFNDWIDDYVKICRQVKPDDAAGEQALQQALASRVMAQFSDSANLDEVERNLKTDIKLNAQGLTHWWRTTQNG